MEEPPTVPTIRTSNRLRTGTTSTRLPHRMRTLFAHNSEKRYINSLPGNYSKIHNSPNIYLIKDFLTEGEHRHLLDVSICV